MAEKPSTRIVKEALRRFIHFSTKSIARHLVNEYGDYMDDFKNVEKVRTKIRYYRGQLGDKKRSEVASKEFFVPDGKKLIIPKPWNRDRPKYKLKEGLWLVLSDLHVPYHEQKPIESAIQTGQMEKVDGILFNGDVQDCASYAFWAEPKRNVMREAEQVIDMFDFLRQEFPDVLMVYKPGNHEYRNPRYFMDQKADLVENPALSFENFLGLEQRGIEFLDFYQMVMAGKLPIFHGHEFKRLSLTVNPARGLFLKTHTFGAVSHCHRTSTHPGRDVHGNDLTTHSFGCLCNLSPDWNPYGNEWEWGFALINVEKDGNFEVVNRRVLPDGSVV